RRCVTCPRCVPSAPRRSSRTLPLSASAPADTSKQPRPVRRRSWLERGSQETPGVLMMGCALTAPFIEGTLGSGRLLNAASPTPRRRRRALLAAWWSCAPLTSVPEFLHAGAHAQVACLAPQQSRLGGAPVWA